MRSSLSTVYDVVRAIWNDKNSSNNRGTLAQGEKRKRMGSVITLMCELNDLLLSWYGKVSKEILRMRILRKVKRKKCRKCLKSKLVVKNSKNVENHEKSDREKSKNVE